MQKRRNASGIIGCILFLGSLILSTTAYSEEYYSYCMVFETNKKQLYFYSDILVSDARMERHELMKAFTRENEYRARRDFPNTQWYAYCRSDASLRNVQEEYHQTLKDFSHAGLKYPFTRPPVPSKPMVSNVSPVPAIIFEETKPDTPTPEQLAEKAAMEREAAANKARMAAASARHDAKVQAAIAEQLRLRKLQGARQ